MLKNLCGKNTPSMESGKQQRTIRIKAMNGTCGQQQSQTAAWGDEAHVLFGQGARLWRDTGRENRGCPAEYLPYLFIRSLIHSVSHFSLCQLSSSMANVQGVADIQENTMHCSWTTHKQINKTTSSTIWRHVRMQHISVFISGVFMKFSRRLRSGRLSSCLLHLQYILSFSLPVSTSISWPRAFTLSVKPIRLCHNLCEPIVTLLSKWFSFSAAVISVYSERYDPPPLVHSFHQILLPMGPSTELICSPAPHLTQIFSYCSSPTASHDITTPLQIWRLDQRLLQRL